MDGTLPPLPDSSWPLMMVPWRRRMPRERRRMPRGRSAVSRRELTRTLMYHTHRGGLRGLAAALLLSLLGRSIAHGSCCIAGFPSPTSRARPCTHASRQLCVTRVAAAEQRTQPPLGQRPFGWGRKALQKRCRSRRVISVGTAPAFVLLARPCLTHPRRVSVSAGSTLHKEGGLV